VNSGFELLIYRLIAKLLQAKFVS